MSATLGSADLRTAWASASRAPCSLMAAPLPAPAATMAAGPEPGSIESADLGLLLQAVTQRLRSAMDVATDAATGKHGFASERLRATVRECSADLELLQASLQREQQWRRQLELSLFDTQLALAQLRVESALGPPGAAVQARALPDAYSRSRRQALHDDLTGLPNRRFFLDRLEHGLNHLSPQRPQLAVFSLDLEGYAGIEAEYGAELGQTLLKVVASRWSRVLRSEDMLSRVDGARFACLRLARAEERSALAGAAAKLVQALARPITLGELSLSLPVRVGMALAVPAGGRTLQPASISAPGLLAQAIEAGERACAAGPAAL